MLRLFSAEICPFAQRTRALLARLGEPYELREVDLEDRDPELLERSPTGKVPLLIDGDLVLYESTVVNDYLAEKLGYERAYALDAGQRARERLAMNRWDAGVLPGFYRTLRPDQGLEDDARRRLAHEVAELARTVAGSAEGSLLAFHVAPFWARMTWLREDSPVPALVEADGALTAWLEKSLALEAVQKTLPDREETVARYREKFAAAPA